MRDANSLSVIVNGTSLKRKSGSEPRKIIVRSTGSALAAQI